MARIKGAKATRKRHKRILKLAKGFRGAQGKQFRVANQAVMRSLAYAYVGRTAKGIFAGCGSLESARLAR